jgi:predicted NACHT family NTPase
MLRETPNGFFNEYIRRGECMFLFDAFDELGTLSAREAVAQRIGELASVSPEGNTFVVTSRIVGYGGELARFGFQTFVVQRLSWDLIRQLVAKWYTALKDSKLTASLLETLSSNQRVAELAVNPMLLSLIVLVQYVRRVIPERRHVLYDECLKILVERRYAPPVVQAEYSKVLPGEEALKIIRDIAYKLHTVRLREIDRRQVEVEIIPSILKSMPLSRASSVDPAEVLRNIEARSQIIVERGLNEAGQPVMAFTHLTFQEYLTAVYLHDAIAKQGEPFTSSTLISFYEDDPEWWEEVALLYAAQLDGLQQKSLFQRIHPRNSA